MQESIVETLKNMKSEQNLTLQQISSASGVPLSTVNRILSGQTENPSFRDVAAIVAAMDGSLDAITGLQKLESENGQLLDSNVMQLLLSMQNYYAKTLDAARQQYMRELENKDKQYRDILTDKNRWLRRMFFCLIGMLAVISFLLIVDFINPTIGVFHTLAIRRPAFCKAAFFPVYISLIPALFFGTGGVPAFTAGAFFHWQHRTIPALQLKHRSGSCGTASALPKCSIMSGCEYPHRASGAKAPRTLRPLPLLRFAVSATGGAHLCSIQYYLRFWLSSCRTSLAVSALRIMRYCPSFFCSAMP